MICNARAVPLDGGPLVAIYARGRPDDRDTVEIRSGHPTGVTSCLPSRMSDRRGLLVWSGWLGGQGRSYDAGLLAGFHAVASRPRAAPIRMAHGPRMWRAWRMPLISAVVLTAAPVMPPLMARRQLRRAASHS